MLLHKSLEIPELVQGSKPSWVHCKKFPEMRLELEVRFDVGQSNKQFLMLFMPSKVECNGQTSKCRRQWNLITLDNPYLTNLQKWLKRLSDFEQSV